MRNFARSAGCSIFFVIFYAVVLVAVIFQANMLAMLLMAIGMLLNAVINLGARYQTKK
ncbi:hypothetical protein [Loigolactobacillus iwatensis]|uniref:hypothetical protein n=1 Tax=Loigolactobacillus iwatensis TaxID=1267156 RepID=UPI0013DD89B8|nr:hypothetical protein [Loigolactobacillus iwatensis]